MKFPFISRLKFINGCHYPFTTLFIALIASCSLMASPGPINPPLSNTITFPALSSLVFSNGQSLRFTATASSGLPITYSTTYTNLISISGSNATVLGAGTATIVASQAGNINYLAAVPVTNVLVVGKGIASLSFSGTNATYSGNAQGVSVTTQPSNLSVGIAYSGSSNLPVNAGTYQVVASVNDANYAGSGTATLSIAKATPTFGFDSNSLNQQFGAGTKFFGGTGYGQNGVIWNFHPDGTGTWGGTLWQDWTWTGYGSSTFTASTPYGSFTWRVLSGNSAALINTNDGTALDSINDITNLSGIGDPVSLVNAGGVPVTISYDLATTRPSGAGSYTVVATCSDTNNFFPYSITNTLVITKGSATVKFGCSNIAYTGTKRAVEVTTEPANLAVVVTYNGSTNLPVNEGTYNVVATVNDTNYTGSGTLTMTLSKQPGHTYDVFGAGTNQFVIDFVKVGGPDNIPDSRSGLGGVSYEYHIGTYTISKNQLEAATLSGLSNIPISTWWSGDQPATAISWYQAAAYVNWLNTSHGYAPAYNLTFTNGAFIMSLWPTTPDTHGNVAWTRGGTNLYRNANCVYFLPSENEWYKAAYFDPAKQSGSGGYWTYPTGSDSIPAPVARGTNSGTLVYNQTSPASVYEAGGLSPIGTMGQGGNVLQWMETSATRSNTNSDDARIIRNQDYSQWFYGPGFWVMDAIPPSSSINNDVGFRVAKIDQGLSSQVTPSFSFVSNSLTTPYSGSNVAVLLTNARSAPIQFTFNGSPSPPSNAGTYTVVATVTDTNDYTPYSITNTLSITPAIPNYTFASNSLNVTYTGSNLPVLLANAGNAPVSVTYNGSTNMPTEAGTYTVVATVTDTNNYAPYSVTNRLTIARAVNVINWTNGLPGAMYGTRWTNGLSATSSSGLPVNFSTASSNLIRISGTNVALLGAGTATIVATQAGNNDYLPAVPVTNDLVIAKGQASISFSLTNTIYSGLAKPVLITTAPVRLTTLVSYSAGSNYPVSSLPPTNAGSYTVSATVNDPNYAGCATATLSILRLPGGSISFPQPPTLTLSNPGAILAATVTNGLPVSYSNSTPAILSVNGSNATALSAGVGVLSAIQSGNSNILPAKTVTNQVLVDSAWQTTNAGYSLSSLAEGLPVVHDYSLSGVCMDARGNVVVVESNAVVKISTNGSFLTVAGGSLSGYVDGPSSNALFNGLRGIVPDGAGGFYVADSGNSAIRRIASNGIVTTVAGGSLVSGNGTVTNPSLNHAEGIAVDSLGNVYVSDTRNNAIRKIATNGVVTTIAGSVTAGFADGAGTNALFRSPVGIVADASGKLYVSDSGNSAIRVITTNGVVTTLAGKGIAGFADGTGTNALFNLPIGVTVAGQGILAVTDCNNNAIRLVGTNGTVTTVAGGGPGSSGYQDGLATHALLSGPGGIVADAYGDLVFSDQGNGAVRVLQPETNGLILTNVSGAMFGQVALPSALGGKRLLGIADSAMAGFTGLQSLAIPSGITTIGSSAFSGCAGLTSVSLPDSVTAFGTNVFAGCGHLTNITASPAMLADLASNAPSLGLTLHSQNLQLPTLSIHTVGDAPFALPASSSAGLPVTYTLPSGNGIGSVSGNTLSFLSAGSTTLTATVPGTWYWQGTNAFQKVVVKKRTQTITFTLPATASSASNPVIPLTGTSSAGLPVTYTTLNTNVLAITGSNAVIVGSGKAYIMASQSGDSNTAPAPNVTASVTVTGTVNPGTRVNGTSSDTFGTGRNTFTIDFVPIGNPGNSNDWTGFGGVPYSYRIGKYTISQNQIDAATRSGLQNVTARAWSGDCPAANISWYEAAAYVNWLNTSKGYAPAYNLTWTNGAWSMALWPTSPDTNGNVAWTLGGTNLYRNASCTYFLPSENEWYKAAYYDPTKNGGSGGYWLYPTGSDTAPTPVASGTNAGTSVYNQTWGYGPGPASVFQAGGLSPYGTMGQGGNVWSWAETSWSTSNTDTQDGRVIRGGGWGNGANALQSSYRLIHYGSFPDYDGIDLGFRVAKKP